MKMPLDTSLRTLLCAVAALFASATAVTASVGSFAGPMPVASHQLDA